MAAPQNANFREALSVRRVIRREAACPDNGSCSNQPALLCDERETLDIVIQKDPLASYCCGNEWLESIMKKEVTPKTSKRPKIQRVPGMLREIESNKRCYDPMVVSIGPYHHGKPNLASLEKLKAYMVREFVKASGIPIGVFYHKVTEVAAEARKCYEEGSTDVFEDEKFAQMMFLDGCFVLQYIWCMVNDKQDAMSMKSHEIAFVQRDLFLLENQLPYLVLEALMNLRFKNNDKDEMIDKFITSTRAPQTQTREKKPTTGPVRDLGNRVPVEDDQPPAHLLEVFLKKIVDKKLLEQPIYHQNDQDWYSYRSAKELKMVGIHFRPSKTHRFTDVEFESKFMSGFLYLPPITVDDATKSFLLNLVAYETCPDAPNDFAVTSYIWFLDTLIDHAEDVKELRSEGILLNFLGSDQQVAELFNEIAIDLVPNPNAYVVVKGKIESHYKNRVNIWMAEWLHTHFSTPWTILAFIAAIFAILLSFVQAYFAAFPKDK
ncbi:Protein of unknown function DUF247, plant [Dillenia turbinata]|uniref:Uncharacterized protein n=1 Tax=Dillenia turbinata TaxID=194707 RepID=A0AAN8W8M4_9MAGN